MTTHLTFSDDEAAFLAALAGDECSPGRACSFESSQEDEIMPGYNDYVDQLTPEQFIKMFWNDATDDMRGCMIDYIDEHPFDGSLKYVAEWIDNLKRTYGLTL